MPWPREPRGFASIATARLEGTPHTLRHPGRDPNGQRGLPAWQAPGYLGMSSQILERVWGHHHPDYMRPAADAITSKQSRNTGSK